MKWTELREAAKKIFQVTFYGEHRDLSRAGTHE
jgi:hypothetical protein